jgi:hypothetical protein
LTAKRIFFNQDIDKISTQQMFDNLRTNARVSWLIRLIPFDPNTQKYLEIGQFDHLGLPTQKYSFVANYQELRGYGVSEAVRMIGGKVQPGDHVSAVIFPLLHTHSFYPANARGLLQVIHAIEHMEGVSISKPFHVKDQTNTDEYGDLTGRYSLDIHSWEWARYGKYFRDYCEVAQKFRCDRSYSVRNLMGDINKDWNPLGFSAKDTDTGVCAPSACEVTDWDQAVKRFSANFGARAFLITNLEISSIKERHLIDFENPDHQQIPDVWNDRQH